MSRPDDRFGVPLAAYVQNMAAERNHVSIVLTGGPCGGKSTALAYLTEKLSDRGIRTLCVPETATLVVMSGITDLGRIATENPEQFLAIEGQLLLMQQDLRRRYEALAESFAPQPVAIIYDRAEMDVMAYTGPDRFRALMDDHRLTLHDVRDRYDAVIHLVTAADGAAEHYTTANNPARRETAEEAVEADRRTLDCWVGHPHLWIADNRCGFDAKLRRVLDAVLHTMGVPHAVEIERKFLIGAAPDFTAGPLAHAARIDIEQTYLTAAEDGAERRVRCRRQDGQTTYFYTEKADRPDGSRQETEQQISATQAVQLRELADPQLRTVTKRRYCFAYAGQYCELDVIDRPGRPPLHMLEIELLDASHEITLPSFLDVTGEVTDDGAYRNAALARIS